MSVLLLFLHILVMQINQLQFFRLSKFSLTRGWCILRTCCLISPQCSKHPKVPLRSCINYVAWHKDCQVTVLSAPRHINGFNELTDHLRFSVSLPSVNSIWMLFWDTPLNFSSITMTDLWFLIHVGDKEKLFSLCFCIPLCTRILVFELIFETCLSFECILFNF